jgi:ATP-binding cassette, subfamily F, member 3
MSLRALAPGTIGSAVPRACQKRPAGRQARMLHVNDITLRFGPLLLFDKATAALPGNARVGFVGCNGVGKTTLFRMIWGELAPESGSISLPRATRLGRVEQEAPGEPQSLIDFVLTADFERARLLAAETAADPARIGEIHTRLIDILAHSALFSQPDLLLLDEPTNYLDLEGTLWLVDYLRLYRATILVISHDRDLLDAVCDHILRLDQAKLALWRANYSSFEQQRREQQAIQLKQKKKQDDSVFRRSLQGDKSGASAVAPEDARQDGTRDIRASSAFPSPFAAKALEPAGCRDGRCKHRLRRGSGFAAAFAQHCGR